MPSPIAVGNWKMHTTVEEAVALVSEMRDRLDDSTGVTKVLCPPFVSLAAVRDLVAGSSIKVGAQNMHHEDKGAFTGEVSPVMLKGLCDYVILGHSERRHFFKETDELVGEKLQAALRTGLQPILCVGELLEEREAGRAEEVVRRQLSVALEGALDITTLLVAYEPVWAIGTGVAATPDDAAGMTRVIVTFLEERYGAPGTEVPLLYGGSVSARNVSDFVGLPEIDGVLVGGASLRADEFVEITRATARAGAAAGE